MLKISTEFNSDTVVFLCKTSKRFRQRQLSNTLWAKQFSRDLGLRCVSNIYPIYSNSSRTPSQYKDDLSRYEDFHYNISRPRQNGCHFPDNIFKCIFLNENVWFSISISLKFVPKGTINNIPALVQIMAWRRPGDKPLSEPMVVSLLTHICATRPQWDKSPNDTLWSDGRDAIVHTPDVILAYCYPAIYLTVSINIKDNINDITL